MVGAQFDARTKEPRLVVAVLVDPVFAPQLDDAAALLARRAVQVSVWGRSGAAKSCSVSIDQARPAAVDLDHPVARAQIGLPLGRALDHRRHVEIGGLHAGALHHVTRGWRRG
jgi:hypothetical protein